MTAAGCQCGILACDGWGAPFDTLYKMTYSETQK